MAANSLELFIWNAEGAFKLVEIGSPLGRPQTEYFNLYNTDYYTLYRIKCKQTTEVSESKLNVSEIK